MNFPSFKHKGNSYFFSGEGNIHYLHPIMYGILNNSSEQHLAENASDSAKADIDYYTGKIKFFKENGLFESKKKNTRYARMSSEVVKKNTEDVSQLVFEVTDSCNLRCSYCAYRELYDNYLPRTGKKLSFADVKYTLDSLFCLWNRKHTLKDLNIGFYGGEPLLNMNFIMEVVNYINEEYRQSSRRISYSITTNGVLLSKYMDFFVENNFHLLISLDGNKENNVYRRNPKNENSFNTVVGNINQLKEKYPEYFRSNVSFSSVLHNKNSVEDIVSFFKETYGKTPMIGEVNANGVDNSKKDKFMHIYKNMLEDMSKTPNADILKEDMGANYPETLSATIFSYTHIQGFYNNYLEVFHMKRSGKHFPTGTCLPFKKKMYLSVNKQIFPCEKIGHNFQLGNFGNNILNLDYEDIAKKYNELYDSMDYLCSSCYASESCTQCLFYLPSIGKCNSYMNKQNFSEFLSKKYSYIIENSELCFRIFRNFKMR